MNYGIIAAGEGSRLQQEGVALPKPLVHLDGQPMIKRLIDIFLKADAETVNVIVNGYMTEVQQYLRQLQTSLPVPLNIVVKTTPSSMHSFYELTSRMPANGKYVVTTVDTIFRAQEFERYIKAFEAAGPEVDGMMPVTAFIDDEKPLYVATDSNMEITGFLDNLEPDTRYVSGGIYGLTPKALPVLKMCLETGVSRMRNYQRALIAGGLRLQAYPFEKIVDVDHIEDIKKADRFIKGTENPEIVNS